MNTLKIRI